VSLVLLLVILAVIAGIAVVAAGRGEGLVPSDPERSPRGALPAGEVGRADVDALRFTLSLRGYRMDEVDDVIDRLVDELDRRDARIAELEQPTAASDDPSPDKRDTPDERNEQPDDSPDVRPDGSPDDQHHDQHHDRRDADRSA
jgi:DivIVA domain-containing protein